MSDEKKITDPILKLVLTALVPAFVFGLGFVVKQVWALLAKVGIYLPSITDAQLEAVIRWIYSLIMEEEKTKKTNDEKLFSVVARINNFANKEQMRIIEKKWGSVENAVNSIFIEKAKAIIEIKKKQAPPSP